MFVPFYSGRSLVILFPFLFLSMTDVCKVSLFVVYNACLSSCWVFSSEVASATVAARHKFSICFLIYRMCTDVFKRDAIDLICTPVASSVSAMHNAVVIVRSLPSLIWDFCVDFIKIPKIKMSTINGIIFALFN